MKKYIIMLLMVVMCLAFTTDLQKRTVREKGFDIECYISLKKLKSYDDDKIYYWFKSGGIHQSLSNIGGDVLHDSYLKYYRSNQIAEQGIFNYGLKTGVWRDWNEAGQLVLQEQWNNGYKHGKSISYNTNGDLKLKGDYKNNIKVGRWINYKTKDTVYYKKDAVFKEKPQGFIKRFLRKKDSTEKVQIKHDRLIIKRTDSLERVKIKFKRKLKKKNDSIKRGQNKLNKSIKKKQDSIKKINKRLNTSIKNDTIGFFKRLFKKKE